MVFNWFRRQVNDKDTPTPQEATVTPAEVEPEAPTTSEEDVAAEYLKRAKAAYQNIQQQHYIQKAYVNSEQSGLTGVSTLKMNSLKACIIIYNII